MHINDFDKVESLYSQRTAIQNALNEVDTYLETVSENDSDYWCTLSQHSDGSGAKICMTGCYVATPMAEATRLVLSVALEKVNNELDKYGVDTKEPATEDTDTE